MRVSMRNDIWNFFAMKSVFVFQQRWMNKSNWQGRKMTYPNGRTAPAVTHIIFQVMTVEESLCSGVIGRRVSTVIPTSGRVGLPRVFTHEFNATWVNANKVTTVLAQSATSTYAFIVAAKASATSATSTVITGRKCGRLFLSWWWLS